MSNNFTGDITLRTPRPRSRRLRETGGTGGSVSAPSQSSAVPDHNQLFGRDSENAHPISAISGLAGYIDTAHDKLKASTVELHGDNDYYGSMVLANTAGADGYMLIQPRQEGIGYRNTILNNSGGNVGIGTTSPSYKLDVNGVSRSQYHYFTAIDGSNAGYIGRGASRDNSIYMVTEDLANGHIVLLPGTSNVGIGTASPSQKLTVNGGVCMQTLYLPNNGAMSTTYSLSVNTNAITAEIPS